jgi:salicylate hydroxylase
MKGTLHLSHQLVSFEEIGDDVTLTFANGTTANCDLLIGMDGIKSVVRRGLLLSQGLNDSPSIEPSWMGQVVYRGLVSEESLNAHFPGHKALDTPMMVCLFLYDPS